jgi:hypothetical protein
MPGIACGAGGHERLTGRSYDARVTEASARPDNLLGRWKRGRWTPVFWIAEAVAIAVIPVIVLLLQYSEEGRMRRNGLRVTATVAGEGSTTDGCTRCRLLFTIDGERYSVEESLVAGGSEEGQRRYFPGETLELYVDPDDKTHAIEVNAIEENIALGVLGIAIAALFAIAWPIFELMRLLRSAIAHTPS